MVGGSDPLLDDMRLPALLQRLKSGADSTGSMLGA